MVLWLRSVSSTPVVYAEGRPWSVQGGLEPLIVGGNVQIREFDIVGTKLDLAEDLDMGRFTVLPFVAIEYRFLQKNALSLSFDYMRLSGDAKLGKAINFNGETFPSGTAIHSTSDLYHLQLLYRRSLTRWRAKDDLNLLAGLDYTRLIFNLESEIPIASQFGGPEDFKQSLPFPVLGLEATYQLSPKMRLEGRFLGMKLTNLNTHQEEGGTLLQDETLIDSTLTATHLFSDRFSLQMALTYRYFTQNLTGEEDGNFAYISGIGVLLSAEYKF